MFRNNTDIERGLQPCSKKRYRPDRLRRFSMYKCEFCDEGWESETEVYYHKEMHVDEVNGLLVGKKPVCLICIKQLKSDESVIQHIKSEHLLSSPVAKCVEREIFVCDQCTTIFFNKSLLVTHMYITHQTVQSKQIIHCPVDGCNRSCECTCMLAHLFKCHTMQSTALCPICLVKCKDRNDLIVHLDSHPLYLRCNFCTELHTKTLNFTLHTDNHRKKIICKRPIRYKQYFVPKFNSKEWKLKLQPQNGLRLLNLLKICILCREICSNETEMRDHILNHRMPKTPDASTSQYMCSCGEEFTSTILLKHHIWKRKDLGTHSVIDTSSVAVFDKNDDDNSGKSMWDVQVEHIESGDNENEETTFIENEVSEQ